MGLAFVVFLVNLIATLGWGNTLSLVLPERWLRPRPAGAAT
jgi:hypothetical protein